MTRISTNGKLLAATAVLFAVAACDSSNNNNNAPPPPMQPPPATATFEVTVTNLTNAQPLSPVAVIAHGSGYQVFEVGSPATVGLEELAEGGSPAALIAEADADTGNVAATASGAGPIGPGGSETISIEVLEITLPTLLISTSTMLVNTNDAITMLNGTSVSDMVPGDVFTQRTIAYDAGTEADTEEARHIPGPAGGGEGFNPARDDEADRVSMHGGVVGSDDGFASSDLNNQHKFDNAVAMVRIERIN